MSGRGLGGFAEGQDVLIKLRGDVIGVDFYNYENTQGCVFVYDTRSFICVTYSAASYEVRSVPVCCCIQWYTDKVW